MNIELIIDNKKIELNDFVKLFFGNILDGAVNSLSGVNENWKEISIKVIK